MVWPFICQSQHSLQDDTESSPIATSVDMSPENANFYMKFCTTVKQWNVHFAVSSKTPSHFSALPMLSSLVVCCWLWKRASLLSAP